MMQKLIVGTSPHLHSRVTTRTLMGRVCLACLPTLAAACLIFGWRSLYLTALSAAACVGFEALWCLLCKKPQTVGDLSAVVTGILLAFNVPATLPIWMLLLGDFVAIVIVKQLFGGIGCNFANPAIVGRIVLSVSFSVQMTTLPYPAGGIDALASATPLAAAGALEKTPVVQLLLGTHGGVLGETAAAALILGGLYLIITGTISAIIPLSTLGAVVGMCIIAGRADQIPLQLLGGGLLLGAFFMATDYVTSPYTRLGKCVYGVGIGVITCLIRFWGTAAEGVSYAILLMNILVPFINRGFTQRPLGVRRAKKGGRAA